MTPVRLVGMTETKQPHPDDVGTVDPLPVEFTPEGVVSVWEPDRAEYAALGLDVRIGVRLIVSGDCAPVRLELVQLVDTPDVAQEPVATA